MPFISLSHVRLRRQLSELRPRLYRVALAWCGDPHRADDLTQEAITKSLASLGQLRDKKALKSWLFSILNNCYRDHTLAKHELIHEAIETLSEQSCSAEEIVEEDQRTLQVRTAIERLATKQRVVLILVAFEGFSYAETAQVLGLPVGTVMSRLNRARQRLRKLLDTQDKTVLHPTTLKSVK